MKSANSFALPKPKTNIALPANDAIPTDLLIGDGWREGSGPRIPVLNPANGEVITTISNASLEDAMAAVDAAEKAAAGWAATPSRQRAETLRRCYDKMIANADWLAHLISLEMGKALSDSKGEVLYAAEFFRWYAEETPRIIGELQTSPGGNNRIMVEYQPIGISLLITPWNFPAAMATRKIAPALGAGCTIILKPAIETPLTAFAVAQIMLDAGVPPGVVNVITPQDPGPICAAIMHDPRVRKLSFTGSTAVGRTLLRTAADTVLSCSMELGGNAPFLVLGDANVDEAVEGAMIAKTRNGGQACTAANRFYVQKSVLKEFTEKFTARMAALKQGDGTDPDTQLGPVITEKQAGKIAGLVDGAVKQGAKLALGGKRSGSKGYFYPATVLTEVPAGATILKDEIFGPVAPIIVFDTEEEAIRLSNDTEYGLSAYLYTKDLKKALKIAEKLEYGMVAINRGLVSDTAAPFGGSKQSGLGREGSHHGLIEFTECKYIAVTW
ncbi:MAG TPA: NAD-dependent succinate-semialdehyde dehydrogenase [Rhizomicrobium sp.]|jgi:succinate-semialdehyde dehydrogenase/glutarate-semialdehyde dehydrogenase|nr:NAD-dependent succinate-semialdehyde dehydrogenase [Rhizomicrobium sp.]